MVSKRDNAQAKVDEWETLGPELQEAYDNKKSERKAIRDTILEYDDQAEVDDYDATTGEEPPFPGSESGEEGGDAAGDQGQGDNQGGDNQGQGDNQAANTD